MMKKLTHNNLTWIDLENPTREEVSKVMADYDIDPVVAQELILPTYKPKAINHERYLYLILHFPAYRHTHCGDHPQEVDFIIGDNFLITARYCHIDQLENISKVFEVQSMIEKNYFADSPSHLFYYIMKEFYKGLNDEIDYINDSLITIEKKIFQGQEKQMVIALSGVSRNLLGFRNSIQAQTETMRNFEEIGREFFNIEYAYNLGDMVSEHYRIEQALDKNIEILAELRETNNSLLSTKQNEIMKTLTIITFIMMPFTIIASMFQMGMEYAPVIGIKYDFYFVVGLESLLALLVFFYAKRKRWF